MIYETCMGDVVDMAGVIQISLRPINQQIAAQLRAPRAGFAIVVDFANGRGMAIEPFLSEDAGQQAVKELSFVCFNMRYTSQAKPPADLVIPPKKM